MMTRVIHPDDDLRTVTPEQWALLRQLHNSMRMNAVVGNVQTLAADAIEALFGEVRRLRSLAEANLLSGYNKGYDEGYNRGHSDGEQKALEDYGNDWVH